MGGVVSAGVDNDELVDKLKAADYIKTPSVEKVFRLVDRGYYLTKDNQNAAYNDNAWRSGNLHLSAPCIYAQVMEGLQLESGMSFLNLGSGTGYLSTMAGLLLGPEGVNHGVEIYGDVVEYARERLLWFMQNAGAIDVSAFCEPQFVQGNALCLSVEIMLYDRVYCGASCPTSHENYMKNLLKVHGVLVMPLNDQLLKVTRTGKTEWVTETLLPVSFSSLIMPDRNYPQHSIQLPPIKIASLQELSRNIIRTVLRDFVEAENQELKESFFHTVPTTMHRGQSDYCRVRRLFPEMTFSDAEDDSDTEGRDEDQETLYDAQRQTASQITAFLDLARSFAMNRNLSEEGADITSRDQMPNEPDSAVSENPVRDSEEDVTTEKKELVNENLAIHIDSNGTKEERAKSKSVDEFSGKQEHFNNKAEETEDAAVNEVISLKFDFPENLDELNENDDSVAQENGGNEENICMNEKISDDNETSNKDGKGYLSAEEPANEKCDDVNDDKNEICSAKAVEEMDVDDGMVDEWFDGQLYTLQNWGCLRKEGDSEVKGDNNQPSLISRENNKDEELKNNSDCDNQLGETPTANGKLVGDGLLSNTAKTKGIVNDKNSCTYSVNSSGKKYAQEKTGKKREKFDSGIGEEIDNQGKNDGEDCVSVSSSTSSALSCSFPSSSNSESDDSDSADHPNAVNIVRLRLRSNGGIECQSGSERKWKVRQAKRKRSHKRTRKIKREAKEDPIQKYSLLMKERIRQLPLPNPLKVYVNYCRPL